MQVVCSNCQLSFQAPDGATGLVCPICRSPLRGADAPAEPEAGPTHQVVEWAGGALDDLVALLSAPSWSARIEVLPASGDTAVGEVHVIAGGVSEAIHDGKSTHDALDKLRGVKGARFRIEPGFILARGFRISRRKLVTARATRSTACKRFYRPEV